MPNAASSPASDNVVTFDQADPLVARARIRRIFQFLDAYVQLRNPVVRQISEQPWVLWLRDLPTSPSITRPDPEKPEERFIFKVRRPTATPCPRPPQELEAWLAPGWDALGAEPRVRESLDEGGKSRRFDDERARTRAFERWKTERAA